MGVVKLGDRVSVYDYTAKKPLKRSRGKADTKAIDSAAKNHHNVQVWTNSGQTSGSSSSSSSSSSKSKKKSSGHKKTRSSSGHKKKSTSKKSSKKCECKGGERSDSPELLKL